jgi:hypothetical protein
MPVRIHCSENLRVRTRVIVIQAERVTDP